MSVQQNDAGENLYRNWLVTITEISLSSLYLPCHSVLNIHATNAHVPIITYHTLATHFTFYRSCTTLPEKKGGTGKNNLIITSSFACEAFRVLRIMGERRMQQDRKLAGSCFGKKDTTHAMLAGSAGISGKLLDRCRRVRKWPGAPSLSAVPLLHRSKSNLSWQSHILELAH